MIVQEAALKEMAHRKPRRLRARNRSFDCTDVEAGARPSLQMHCPEEAAAAAWPGCDSENLRDWRYSETPGPHVQSGKVLRLAVGCTKRCRRRGMESGLRKYARFGRVALTCFGQEEW